MSRDRGPSAGLGEVDLVAAPFSAVRWLRLFLAADGRVLFAPLNQPRAFRPADQAHCLAGEKHAAPQASCRCGFYACRDRAELDEVTVSMGVYLPSSLLLADVLLWGRVVEHERGLRGEWQQVVQVHVPPAPCGHAADGFAVDHVSARLDVGQPPRRREARSPSRLLRPACSACEPVEVDLGAAAADLSVRFVPADATSVPCGPEFIPDNPHRFLCAMSAVGLLTWMVVTVVLALFSSASPSALLSPDRSAVSLVAGGAWGDVFSLLMLNMVLLWPLAAWLALPRVSLFRLAVRMVGISSVGVIAMLTCQRGVVPASIDVGTIAATIDDAGGHVVSHTPSSRTLHVIDAAGTDCRVRYDIDGRSAELDWLAGCVPALTP